MDDITVLIGRPCVTGFFPGQAKGSQDESTNEEMVEKALCSSNALRLQIFVSCTGKNIVVKSHETEYKLHDLIGSEPFQRRHYCTRLIQEGDSG